MHQRLSPKAVGSHASSDAAQDSVIGANLFFDGGEMGALMRAKDWTKTPLGPPEQWPQSLATAVRIILQSRYPMFVWWGKELTNLYNDPYSPFLGKKHPAALGRPAQEAWSDIWDQVGPRAEAVVKRGESTYDQNLLLMMDRHGYVEETYFTFSYSPLPDDEGGIGGLFCAVTEETDRVIGERRLRLLRKLGSEMANARTPESVCRLAAERLKDADRDLPFVLIYLYDANTNALRRVASVGIGEHPAAPEKIELDAGSLWRVDEVMASGNAIVLDELRERVGDLPTGAWSVAPESAFVIPLAQQGQERPMGVVVAGVNPHRKIGEDFAGFVSLLAGQLSASVANANAYEVERKRAEALAELDRAKTAFFSNVSHEFRTPITLLLGPLEEALAQEGRSAKDTARLETAHRNGLRLLKLVNSLLDFSRIEAGRQQATFEPVEMGTFTADLASGFRSLIEGAGLKLEVECPEIDAEVYVDPEMWEKVVLNLLSNAFKYTHDGGITVKQSLHKQRLVLTVSDTGVGIPERELPNVFNRFHRVEGIRGRSFEGTGIGLALVQELVKLHGGTVRVESAEGRGTTFTVTVPVGKAHLPTGRIKTKRSHGTANRVALFVEEAGRWVGTERLTQASETSPTARVARAVAGWPTILIVDDNADMRDYLSRLLSDRYGVRVASNGEEAAAIAAEIVPDVVLTDAMMPVLDGVGLVKRLRDDVRTRTVPIIMLSARAGEEARIAGLESGADDYLTKPFTAAELLARVSTHLNMAQMRREAEERERALRDEAEKLQQRVARTLDSITDAFILLDRDFRITYVNPEAARLNGKPAAEFIGKTPWEEWPTSAGSETELAYRRAMAEQVPAHLKYHYVDDNRDLFLDIHAYPTEDGLAIYYRDVTEREKAQQALLRSEKLAAMGRLAASIAHEINNPLASVTNLLFLIEKAAIHDDVKTYVRMADEELRRVAQIATQTLRFHRQASAPSEAMISGILDSILTLYHGRFANAGIVVERELRDDRPVFCLEGEVRQALTNIIANALDAMPLGGRLHVRTSEAKHRFHEREGVLITIADTGDGMPQSAKERLFEAFFTTKGMTGTGLGLWISKGIIDKHGGRIQVKSSQTSKSRGTVFRVFLPYHPEAGLVAPQNAASA